MPDQPLSAYQQKCRGMCEWCAADRPRTYMRHEHLNGAGLMPGPSCTAPTLEQFAEELAKENERLRETMQTPTPLSMHESVEQETGISLGFRCPSCQGQDVSSGNCRCETCDGRGWIVAEESQ